MIKRFYLKDMKASDDLSFCLQKAALTSDFPAHNHDFSELVIILRGRAKHIIDAETYEIGAGDVYVIGGEISHGFVEVEDLELCNIMLDTNQLIDYFKDLRKMTGFQALFVLEPFYRREHQFKSRLRLELATLKQVEKIINMMLDEYTAKREGYETVLQSYLLWLIVFLSRRYTESKRNGINAASRQLLYIADAVAYMERHFLEPIRLNDLSYRANMSTRHFGRVFKQNYGTTPMEYVIRLRLEHAAAILAKDGNATVAQAALESGFCDSNYFARQFRKFFGISPSEYIRKSNEI